MASRQFSKPCWMLISSLRRQQAVRRIAREIDLHVGVREPELVTGEPARMRLGLGRPFPARPFVEHVLRRGMIVDAHAVAELAAEQRRGRNVEDLSREIPQRHLDAADGPHQVVRRAIGARAAEVARADAHVGVERVDLERILADEPRLERQDAFLHADAGASVRLGDAEIPVICGDFHQRVGAAAFEHHHLHVANLRALALGRHALGKAQEPRQRRAVAEEFSARDGHAVLL